MTNILKDVVCAALWEPAYKLENIAKSKTSQKKNHQMSAIQSICSRSVYNKTMCVGVCMCDDIYATVSLDLQWGQL